MDYVGYTNQHLHQRIGVCMLEHGVHAKINLTACSMKCLFYKLKNLNHLQMVIRFNAHESI